MSSQPSIIAPEGNCWRAPQAARLTPLVDAAAYYAALRSSLLKAERSVFIVGWDVDSRVRLAGEQDPGDGAPLQLKDFLTYLVERKPDLRIHVLMWDFSILYAMEREPMPALNLRWTTPEQIEVCLDDIVPLGASHHQKIVIIDNKLAYCGGIDLAIRRWDTRAHRADQPLRVDPGGTPYKPFHDVQCVLDGDAASTLAELVTERWEAAACRTPPKVDAADLGADPWPDGVQPLFTEHPIAIARTVAPLNRRPGVYEVERLYLDMIAAARDCIYIENQFLTAGRIARALADALSRAPDLELIMVSSRDPHGFLEAHSMATGRERFMQVLEDAGVVNRVRLVHPRVDDGTAEGQDVLVHAKVMVVDDTLMRIGSSNLNNRSMGTDGECDLMIEARNAEDRNRIATFRNDLIAEHTGLGIDELAAERERLGSFRALIDARADSPRTLRRTDYKADAHEIVADAFERVADPERPSDASQFLGDMMSARAGRTPIRGRWLAAGALALVALFIAVWQVSPMAQFTDPERLEQVMIGLRGDPWAYVIVPLAFVFGSSLVFPITAMIAATAFVFPPLSAFLIAFAGSLLGASANYGVGAVLGRTTLRRMMGRRLNRISRALARQGVMTVVTLRIVPVAPFTLINMVAGASHIRFADFLLGTVIGLTPGIVTMTLVGSSLFRLLKDPTPGGLVLVAGAIALWVAVSYAAQRGLRYLSTKWQARRART